MSQFTQTFILRQIALSHKATPQPWATFWGQLRQASEDGFALIANMPEGDDRPADFEFIAEAVNNYPDALHEILRLRGLILEWSKADDPEHPAVEALSDEAERIRESDEHRTH